MKKSNRSPRRVDAGALAFTILAPAVMSLYAMYAWGADVTVTLAGAQEVPPVTTSATGTAMLTISGDRAVSGTLTTTGIEATAAHIHEAPSGKNGGVIVPFVKSGDKWAIAPGAKLTEPQFKAFQDGNLYVNVHSAAHKDGEIRGQLKP
jgi:CHRD domain-containing protein